MPPRRFFKAETLAFTRKIQGKEALWECWKRSKPAGAFKRWRSSAGAAKGRLGTGEKGHDARARRLQLKERKGRHFVRQKHEAFWDGAYEAFGGKVARAKTDGFKAAAGTLLYFYDEAVVQTLQENFPRYAENFPLWAREANAMLQISICAALRELEIGANFELRVEVFEQGLGVPSALRLRVNGSGRAAGGLPALSENRPLESRKGVSDCARFSVRSAAAALLERAKIFWSSGVGLKNFRGGLFARPRPTREAAWSPNAPLLRRARFTRLKLSFPQRGLPSAQSRSSGGAGGRVRKILGLEFPELAGPRAASGRNFRRRPPALLSFGGSFAGILTAQALPRRAFRTAFGAFPTRGLPADPARAPTALEPSKNFTGLPPAFQKFPGRSRFLVQMETPPPNFPRFRPPAFGKLVAFPASKKTR